MASSLLIYAAGQKPAIDDYYLSRDKAGGFGREKNRGATQIFYLPESFHRGAQKEIPCRAQFR